ncbi:MAG: cupin domain-containing protein [Candidatus Bathyarchaeota archaeon]|nr:cupin domain-containing protein [Candidatus Bathyarchaeota archaeon]
MVKVAVLDLNDPKNWNHWIIGTPTEVPESSPFYSEQIQIAHVKNLEKGILEKEPEHYHSPPIEEFYLVLRGILKVKVEDNIIVLKPKQILAIPPNKRHKILNYSLPIQFFTIRAPISTEKTK